MFPLVPATAANKVAIASAIASVVANGGTDLASGLLEAVSMLSSSVRTVATPVSTVFLFTDGEPTDGWYRTEAAILPQLHSCLRTAATQGSNIKVSAPFVVCQASFAALSTT